MPNLRFRHHNNCPRCPVIGAEDIPGEEYYEILSLRFNVGTARELSAENDLIRIDALALARWLEHARILESHLDHLPLDVGHGIMATLPAGCGRPLIDGNHRATRALRRGETFFATVLNEAQTHELLRRSMGCAVADHYWKRMLISKPHSNDR